MTQNERAVALRKEFKERGWNSRKVGVRSRSFSLSGEIVVTIKDPVVPYHEVKKLSTAYERIHRCEISHEILGGGNTFVDVLQSDERKEVLVARYLEALTAAVAKIEGNYIVDVTDNVGVSNGNWDTEFMLWIDGRGTGMHYNKDEWGFESAALAIALRDPDQAERAA